MQTLAMPLIYV